MAEANPSIQINEVDSSDNPGEEFELHPLISSNSISKWIDLDRSKTKKKIVAGMRLKSILAKRTSSQATIFLFGSSGVGKSTTLKYLFDSDIIPTSRDKSSTRKVTEYSYSINSSELGNELKIGFIDTPGLGDTNGLDPENLANISHFIDSHKELKEEIYPSIVLVFVSALDNRIFGINSSFSKSLYILSKLGVVDDIYPNTVIVVTHAMHLKENYIEESKRIKKNCKTLARAHFCIEVPVVFIENLDKGKEMAQEGHWRILPDGTRQPLNLFEAMIHLMKQSGDEVGVEAVRLCFNESGKSNIPNIGKTPDHSNNSKITLWRKIIQERLSIPKENQIYESLSKKFSDDSKFLAFVYNLQKAGIIYSKQLQNASITFVKEKVFPFLFTGEEVGWLFDIFDVKRVNVKVNLRLIGLGYSREFNQIRSQVLDSFCPNYPSKIHDNFVMLVPQICNVQNVGKFYVDDFQVIGETWRPFTNFSKLRFRIYHSLFQVNIANLDAVRLNNLFIASLEESLPKGIEPFNLEYKFQNLIFINFLQKYGLHCVTGAYYGGFIEGELLLESKKDPAENKAYLIKSKKELNSQLKTWIKCIRRESVFNPDVNDVTLFHALSNSTLTWRGGNRKYYCNKLLNMTTVNWNHWIDSLEGNVILFENFLNYVPLYNILLNSPSENVRSYADDFSIITGQDRPNLDALLALDSDENVDPHPEPGPRFHNREDASNQYKSKCFFL